jgi:cytoskeleton protein RodZ
MRLPDFLQRSQRAVVAQEQAAEQRDRAEAMGRRLRERRMAQGISLADVERDTRVNRLYLEALEQAQYETIPAPIYARGFMRAYARHLGIDPEEAAAAVPLNLPRPAGLEPLPGMRRTAPPALPAVNAPIVAALAAGAVLVLIAIVVVPRLGGGPGIDLPGATPTPPTTPATSPATPAAPPATVTVPPFEDGETPDFRGVSRDEAERVIAEIGAVPLLIEAQNTAAPGTVFDQTPAPGEPLEEGDGITLFISVGPGQAPAPTPSGE